MVRRVLIGRLRLSSVRVSLLVLVLLAGLPGLALTLYTGLEQRRSAAARVQAEAMQLVRLTSAEEKQLIDETRVLLIEMARYPEVRRRQDAACTALLRDLLRLYPRYANLGAADPAGNAFCSAVPFTQPVNIADREYFRRAVQTRGFAVGEYQIGRVTGKASVNAGYPLLDSTGQVQAVVFAALSLSWLNELAGEAQLPPGAALSVVDARGTILARHPEPERWVGRSLPEVPSIKAILVKGGEGTTEATGVDGVRRLYAFAPLTRSPQAGGPFVSIGIPTAVAYAGANRLLLRNFVGLAVVILVALAAAWWAGDLLLLRRVRALVRATNRLGTGDLSVRTGVPYGGGEFGRLTRAFDDMADALQKREAEAMAAEAALGASEQRFRRLTENAPDVIFQFRLAPEFGVEYINPAVAATTGYAPAEVYADRDLPFQVIHPEDLPVLQAALQDPAAHSGPLHLRWRRKDGTLIWTEQRIVPVYDDSGTLVAVEGIARDITDLKQADEEIRALNAQLERRVAERTAEMREAKAFLEHLITTSPGILFQANAADDTATYISPNLDRLLGYCPEEVVGVPYFFLEHMHPDDRTRTLAEDNEHRLRGGHAALAGKEIEVVREIRYGHKNGSYRWFSVAMRIGHDEAGNRTTILGHALDITERKLAEDAMLEARAEAERANLAKSEFLSRMSHELRTPLHSILGFGQLLEMDLPRPEQAESIQQILRAGRHLLGLINEVLDIARIEAGRVSISPEPVPVGELVHESLDLIAPMAAAKRVQLQGHTAGASDQYVHADRQRLKQVLLNLLSNAVKYNRPDGTVTLALSEPAPGRLRISVGDTGPGIPADRLERLFKPFERLHAEQMGVEGIGLGLALSKRLVEAMGGQIGVETTVGVGSTFWVEAALVPSPQEQPGFAAAGGAERNGPERTVLYIEDNLANVRLVERILAHRPRVRLLTAMQGRLGLDLIREHRPDLVLLDIHLSDLQGDEVMRLLQEDARTREIPIVVISATEDRRILKRLLAEGARAYLTKPLDAQRLLSLLDEILPVPVAGEQGA